MAVRADFLDEMGLKEYVVLGTIIVGLIWLGISEVKRQAKVIQERIDNPPPKAVVVPEEVFRKDGCIMYKFRDAGYTHYYSDCANITVLENKPRSGR